MDPLNPHDIRVLGSVAIGIVAFIIAMIVVIFWRLVGDALLWITLFAILMGILAYVLDVLASRRP